MPPLTIRLLAISGAAALTAISPLAAQPVPEEIGLARAVALAEQSESAAALEAERDIEAGRAVYEIDLTDGRATRYLVIEATSGRILSRREAMLGNAWRGLFGGEDARALAAVRLAPLLEELERETGGAVADVGFEREDGAAWYEIDLRAPDGPIEVNIDPFSGKRLAVAYDD